MQVAEYDEYTLDEIDENLPPVAGAMVIATLDKGFQSSYQELATAELELQTASEELQKRMLERLGGTLAQWDGEDQAAFMERLNVHKAFDGDDQAERYFELVTRWEYLNASFWYSVKLQYKCFSKKIGLRSGFKIVDLGYKYAV